MKKLKLFIIPLLISIAAIFFLVFPNPINNNSSQSPRPENISPIQQQEKLDIRIDYGNGEIVQHSFDHQEGQSAFSLLKLLAKMELVEIETKQYDFGVFVKSINTNESSAEMSWIYFVNGESGQVAADQHILNPGDLVEWRYIEPNSSL